MHNPNFDDITIENPDSRTTTAESSNHAMLIASPQLLRNEESLHQLNTTPNTSSTTTRLIDDHCHVNIAGEKDRNKVVWYKLITVFFLCILFMVGEIVGGILAQSISIQTDAAHMAADIAGFFFSILAIYVSKKG